MSQFHDQTLKLLGPEGIRKEQPVPTLMDWSKEKGVALPGAYVEWAKLDPDGQLLRKYSNGDHFWFEPGEIIVTQNGFRGIGFHQESQGNYTKMLLLDRGDNPPVLWNCEGHPSWVQHAASFSDCVFAQIFDWQYWLEFDADDPTYREITG